MIKDENVSRRQIVALMKLYHMPYSEAKQYTQPEIDKLFNGKPQMQDRQKMINRLKNGLNINGDKKSEENIKQSNISQAKTANEAAKIAVDSGLSKHADFKTISVETANLVNETISNRKNEYPSIGEFEYIGNNATHINLSVPSIEQYVRDELMKIPVLANNPDLLEQSFHVNVRRIKKSLSMNSNTTACFFSGEGYGLRAVKFHAKNMEDLTILERDVKSGFHPVGTGTKQGIIDHELGHALHDSLGLSNHKEINRLYDENMKNGTMSKELSRYVTQTGNQNRTLGLHEFTAEAFSEYKNNPNPRPLAIAVGKIIDEENKNWIKTNTKK